MITSTLLALWLGLQSGDAVTTHVALARGGHERNPLLTQHALVNDGLFALGAGEMIYAVHRLKPQHPRLAVVVLVGGIALEGWAVRHNLDTLNVQR